MYNYTNRDWLNLEEALSLLEKLSKDPLSVHTDKRLVETPIKKSVAPVDPVNPSYYPQPDVFAYAEAHGLTPKEFSVVKYVTRWRKKDGIKDLYKALNCLNKLIVEADAKVVKTKPLGVMSASTDVKF